MFHSMEHPSYPRNSLPQDAVMTRNFVMKLQRKSNVPPQIIKSHNYIWLHINHEKNVKLGRPVKFLVSEHKQSMKLSPNSQRTDYFIILQDSTRFSFKGHTHYQCNGLLPLFHSNCNVISFFHLPLYLWLSGYKISQAQVCRICWHSLKAQGHVLIFIHYIPLLM